MKSSRSAFILLLTLISLTVAFKITEDEVSATPNPYTIFSVSTTPLGVTALAKLTLGGYQGAPEDVIQNITITIQYDNAFRVRVKVTDTNNPNRWQFPGAIPSYSPSGPLNFYNVNIAPGPLSVKITRNSDGKTVFYLNPSQPFYYNDQDIAFGN